MSIATYGGIKYDTQLPKEEFAAWHKYVEQQKQDNFTYRGKEYHWDKSTTK